MDSRRYLLLAILVPAAACSEGEWDRDRDPEPPSGSSYLVEAGAPGAWSSPDRFAIGLRAPLRVRADGLSEFVSDGRCLDGRCLVERIPRDYGRFDLMVTALAPRFRIQVTVERRHGPFIFERDVDAVEAPFDARHDGPGPGMPLLAGTAVTLHLETANDKVAWDPTASRIEVTGPFTIEAVEPGRGYEEGTAHEQLRVTFRPREAGRGILIHTNGTVRQELTLDAVARDTIASLGVARIAPSDPRDPWWLATRLTRQITLAPEESQRLWVVFATKDGALGIAGAGESLPEAPGTFDVMPPPVPYGTEPEAPTRDQLKSQPYLAVVGVKAGRSRLRLRVDDVVGSAEVVVR